MDNLSQYTEEEYQQIFQRKVSQLTKNISVNEKPQAFILGGQAGSGKSSLHKIIKEEMQGNVIVIDNDTFKPLHPNYDRLAEKIGIGVTEQVKPFSDRLTEDLIEYLSNEQYNLVVEGTLRTIETPLKTNQQLREKGYSTNLYVMATEQELSYLSTLERYADMFIQEPDTARATPKKIHDEIVDKISSNLDTIYKKAVFDDISAFTREGNTIYSMKKTPLKSPKKDLQDKLDSLLSNESKNRIISRLKQKIQIIQDKQSIKNETIDRIKNVVEGKLEKEQTKEKAPARFSLGKLKEYRQERLKKEKEIPQKEKGKAFDDRER